MCVNAVCFLFLVKRFSSFGRCCLLCRSNNIFKCNECVCWQQRARAYSFIGKALLLASVILVSRGRAPFGQHQKSRPLARSNDIPVLNGFVNTIDWDQNQSDLSDLTQSMRRVTGSPWIADFRYWTRSEVAILGADQKERGLWGRECASVGKARTRSCTPQEGSSKTRPRVQNRYEAMPLSKRTRW